MYEQNVLQVQKGSPMFIEFLTMQSTVYSQFVFEVFKRKPFCKLSTIKFYKVLYFLCLNNFVFTRYKQNIGFQKPKKFLLETFILYFV